MTRKLRTSLLATFAAASIGALAASAAAQPGPGGGPRGPGGGGGMMMGPGMGPGMMGRMCGPRAAGFAEWRLDRLERRLVLTDAQRSKFGEFRTASSKAAEALRAACPAEAPQSPADRMAVMEKRAEAQLQAIRTVRPAFDGFYATLSEEQKQEFAAGRGRYWRWRDRW